MTRVPCIVIAGTHSGAGKTTVATALMTALSRRGLRVQPFKVGPDFIDPGFPRPACGRVSRNLDGWMLTRATNLELFARASQDADIAIVEGVMGLFDGRGAESEDGSTAQMAKWLGAAVLLVADASAMARSAAAVIHGFESFDPDLDLAGVIFNRIGGSRHAELLRDSVRHYCRAELIGSLPRNDKIAIPSRHLGLTLATEALNPACLDEMSAWIEANLDLDRLLTLAGERAPSIDAQRQIDRPPQSNVRIAIAQDRAFCFYYQDNLDLLARYGADLAPFSPIDDSALPDGITGIYLGGGYPELHAQQLSSNRSMLRGIREFAESGGPIYAECGGFMYLTEAILDADGREYPMVGIFPTRARMQSRLAALGYVEPDPNRRSLWAQGCSLRGHEFRYSKIDPMPESIARIYREPIEGYRRHSVLASYIHLHFLASPKFAEQFVQYCASCALTITK